MSFSDVEIVYLVIREYTHENGDEDMSIVAFTTLDKCKKYLKHLQEKSPEVNSYYVKAPLN